MSTSEYDYIIVGSGAGGGPLACRLAENGKRVLVLEAGSGPTNVSEASLPVSLTPGLHAASTEDPALSWEFFVRHYGAADDVAPDRKDEKWHEGFSPEKTGIFYPRAAGVGGCTVHNATITIVGPDSDWDELADFLKDESWASGPMRHHFRQLEKCEYLPAPTANPSGWWFSFYDNVRWLIGMDPDHQRGRHGFGGWLHTSIVDVKLALRDKPLFAMLKAAVGASRRAGIESLVTLFFQIYRGKINQHLDPNHATTLADSPEGITIIPLSVCGPRTPMHHNQANPNIRPGRRSSPREFLLETVTKHPDNLTIRTQCFVTRVLFDAGSDGKNPRAVGVEVRIGKHLYHAHPKPETPAQAITEKIFVNSTGEVILCGGTFNTPQMLMLSGIGDANHLESVSAGTDHCSLRDRKGNPILKNDKLIRIHLPGVGTNLHDRYEVSLVTLMKQNFRLLNGAKFTLPMADGPVDPHYQEWSTCGTGLYASNGAVIGIFKRSRPELPQPDLFVFGIPSEFRGYKVGYSKISEPHNKFTWVILKGHTNNHKGTVRLRNVDPFATPLINFHSFNEDDQHPGGDHNDADLAALVEGVKFVREITREAAFWGDENYPLTEAPPDKPEQIKDWIRKVAWGHHACGTCRMGPSNDDNAVLDNRFRVRGVDGLRVVDASIFPKIPGYFIVANIYMASEKAATVILEDAKPRFVNSPSYPRELAEVEIKAVTLRRGQVDHAGGGKPNIDVTTNEGAWANHVTGLALSGGGVRSATFNLGVLQTLAAAKKLRNIDFLSTVSGGGYIGAFLGRFFDRTREVPLINADRRTTPEKIEEELLDRRSPELTWLRKHGNYIAPSGKGDVRLNLAIFVRGFFSVHFVIGALVFAIFCVANLIRYGLFDKALAAAGFVMLSKGNFPLGHLLENLLGPFFSPWFVAFELVLLFLVVPRVIAYWLVSEDRHQSFQTPTLVLVFLSSAVLFYLSVVQGDFAWEPFFIASSILSSFIFVEFAWRRGRIKELATGSGNPETQRQRTRNYLTYDLGFSLAISGFALIFAVVDTIGHGLQQWVHENNDQYALAFASIGGFLVSLMPIAKLAANGLVQFKNKAGDAGALFTIVVGGIIEFLLNLVLILTPLTFYSFAAHAAFLGGAQLWAGLGATIFALIVSLVLTHRRALMFVNRSSLSTSYAARLARAYLGATNPARHVPEGANVTEVVPGDDVPSIHEYTPHKFGGPIHIINAVVNQTVDFTSQRGNRDRKADIVAVSSLAMTIGTRYHAAWVPNSAGGQGSANDDCIGDRKLRRIGVKTLGHLDGTEHPLLDLAERPAKYAEVLSLREWIGLSGAAFTPGQGQYTKLRNAILFGIANLRTGYWWDSGITKTGRDGFPDWTFLRRLFVLAPRLFLTQALLLREWLAKFPGPWTQYWYISDGGFFENLGGYELIRRKLPRIILCDASADPRYEFTDFANLVRKVRIDFNAHIAPFTSAEIVKHVPESVRWYIGGLEELKPELGDNGQVTKPAIRHAALFWVHYPDRAKSALLYIKATVTAGETADVKEYRIAHPEFPHESTINQFFDEPQWESYRRLGEEQTRPLFENQHWFWELQS
jgi:choline dehydrogenase-like flavoprotein